MGATSGIFGRPEIAVMVAVVLLTTLLTPVALRAAYHLKSPQDFEEGLADSEPNTAPQKEASFSVAAEPGTVQSAPEDNSLRAALTPSKSGLVLGSPDSL
jgi:hypothetical protein